MPLREFWVLAGLSNAQLIAASSPEEARERFLSPPSRLKPQMELFADGVIEVTA